MSEADSEGFVAALSPEGEGLWSVAGDTYIASREAAIMVDPSNHLLVTGSYIESASFGCAPVTASDGRGVFLVKLRSPTF